MKNLIIKQQLTFEQYINSGYPMQLTGTCYANQIKPTHNGWKQHSPKVFIVEADPCRDGYGNDFQVYLQYNADGINFLKRLSYTSSGLNSNGLVRANCLRFVTTFKEGDLEMMLNEGLFTKEEVDTISFGNECYDKCASNRRQMRKMDYATFF